MSRITGRGVRAVFVAMGLAATFGPDRAQTADEAGAVDVQHLAHELVAQLGSPSFRARQNATSKLNKLGAAAKPVLLTGLNSADAEVRLRCQRVLDMVLEQEYLSLLAAFAADKDDKIDHQFPGWNRFQTQIGKTPEARSLFVEMLLAEPALMKATEAQPNRAAGILAARCRQVQGFLDAGNFGEREQPSLGTLTALFLLAADPQVIVVNQTNYCLGNFSREQAIQGSINCGPKSDLLRKLLGAWVGRTDGSGAAFQGLVLSLRYDLREGLGPATNVCKHAGGHPNVLLHAILVVGKFGAKEHVAFLEPLLTNTGICAVDYVNNEMFRAEVRDVALAVLVHLTGQDLKEFGFSRIEKNQMFLFTPSSLGFRENDSRPGLEKWKAWSLEQKKTPPG